MCNGRGVFTRDIRSNARGHQIDAHPVNNPTRRYCLETRMRLNLSWASHFLSGALVVLIVAFLALSIGAPLEGEFTCSGAPRRRKYRLSAGHWAKRR
jgi:hypothetical protein